MQLNERVNDAVETLEHSLMSRDADISQCAMSRECGDVVLSYTATFVRVQFAPVFLVGALLGAARQRCYTYLTQFSP